MKKIFFALKVNGTNDYINFYDTSAESFYAGEDDMILFNFDREFSPNEYFHDLTYVDEAIDMNEAIETGLLIKQEVRVDIEVDEIEKRKKSINELNELRNDLTKIRNSIMTFKTKDSSLYEDHHIRDLEGLLNISIQEIYNIVKTFKNTNSYKK